VPLPPPILVCASAGPVIERASAIIISFFILFLSWDWPLTHAPTRRASASFLSCGAQEGAQCTVFLALCDVRRETN
jgi:hypothetical protein